MARGLEISRREVSLATIHPAGLLPRRVQKHWFTRQLHRREVLAVGWEPQNSSPTVCDGDGIRKIDLCAALLVIVRPLLQQARINRA